MVVTKPNQQHNDMKFQNYKGQLRVYSKAQTYHVPSSIRMVTIVAHTQLEDDEYGCKPSATQSSARKHLAIQKECVCAMCMMYIVVCVRMWQKDNTCMCMCALRARTYAVCVCVCDVCDVCDVCA